MKLSFSTRGWGDMSWEQMVESALDMKFSGIEVYFPSKPDEATREALKGDGWRWHRQKGCWYNKNTEQHLQTLRSITENPQQLTA